jgi:hypothetical protein
VFVKFVKWRTIIYMADKKDDKKESSGKTAEEVFILLFILFLLSMLVMRAVAFFSPNSNGNGITNSAFERLTGGPNGWFANLIHYVNVTVSAYVTIATIFSIVTFLVILYIAWLSYQLNVEDKKKNKLAVAVEDLPSMQSQKWRQVLSHVNSQNPAEWRLSILEADVILDDMMKSLGFHGETIGDMLKNTPKGDFKTIDLAWEAHKIRNAIAHEGSDFLLSQRESRRVVGLYETVFKEFSYI